MDTSDKLKFVFAVYDFKGQDSLSSAETALLLRHATKGLAKACPTYKVFADSTTDDNIHVDPYATLIFKSADLNPHSHDRVTSTQLRTYCMTHVVISTWLKQLTTFPTDFHSSAPRFESEFLVLNSTVTRREVPDIPVATFPKKNAALSAADHQSFLDTAAAAAKALEPPTEEELAIQTQAAAIAKAAIKLDDDGEPIPVVLPPLVETIEWKKKVAVCKPEELPPARPDAPEDIFEAAWVCGVTAASATGAKRFAHYHSPLTGKSGFVYSASSKLVHTQKPAVEGGEEEEGAVDGDAEVSWSQSIYSEHTTAITTMSMQQSRGQSEANKLVTADNVGRVVVWETNGSTGATAVAGRMVLPCGVKALDIDSQGKLLLVALDDAPRTTCIYTVPTLRTSAVLVYSTELSANVDVCDVRFAHAAGTFGVATSQGFRFFAEAGRFMGQVGCVVVVC
jgi:hypothetical protein